MRHKQFVRLSTEEINRILSYPLSKYQFICYVEDSLYKKNTEDSANQEQKPLSEEEITKAFYTDSGAQHTLNTFHYAVRWTEKMHGIGGEDV